MYDGTTLKYMMRHVLSVADMLFAAHKGAGAVAQTIVARFFIAGIGVCTGLITARVLGATGRGEQSAMLVWPTLLAYLLTLGLPAAIRYRIMREPERRSEFFTLSILAGAVASIAAMLVGVAFIPFWLRNYSADVVHSAQVLMIFAPEVLLGLILTAMLETLREFSIANISRYIAAVLTLVSLISLAVMHKLTPFTAACSYTIPSVIVACWLGWRLRAHILLRFFDPRPGMKLLASYGFRSYGIDLLTAISSQIDQVFVIGLLSATDVGIYVVALNASRIITIVHGGVVSVVVPSALGLEPEAVVAMVGRSARVSTALACLFGAALAAAVPFLLPAIYGPSFGGGVQVAQLLTLEAILNGLVLVLAQSFMALGRPGAVTLFEAVSLATIFPLMLALLPRLGLVGAAVAILTATILRLILTLAAYPMLLKVAVPNLFPTADDVARVRHALVNR
jgi:antigen flippase